MYVSFIKQETERFGRFSHMTFKFTFFRTSVHLLSTNVFSQMF